MRQLGIRLNPLLYPRTICPSRRSSDLLVVDLEGAVLEVGRADRGPTAVDRDDLLLQERALVVVQLDASLHQRAVLVRSEEHTSELQSQPNTESRLRLERNKISRA